MLIKASAKSLCNEWKCEAFDIWLEVESESSIACGINATTIPYPSLRQYLLQSRRHCGPVSTAGIDAWRDEEVRVSMHELPVDIAHCAPASCGVGQSAGSPGSPLACANGVTPAEKPQPPPGAEWRPDAAGAHRTWQKFNPQLTRERLKRKPASDRNSNSPGWHYETNPAHIALSKQINKKREKLYIFLA